MFRIKLLIPFLMLPLLSESANPSWWRQDNTHLTLLRMNAQVYTGGMLLAPDINLALRLGPNSNSYFGFYGDYAVVHHPTYAVRQSYPYMYQRTWHTGASFIHKLPTGWHLHSTLSLLRGEEEYSGEKIINLPGNQPFQRVSQKLKGYDMTIGTFYKHDEVPLLIGFELFFRQSNGVMMGTGTGIKVSLGFRF